MCCILYTREKVLAANTGASGQKNAKTLQSEPAVGTQGTCVSIAMSVDLTLATRLISFLQSSSITDPILCATAKACCSGVFANRTGLAHGVYSSYCLCTETCRACCKDGTV